MQFFAKRIRRIWGSFIPIPKGTLPQARRASVKELGACTLRARFAGGKSTTNNKNIKIFKFIIIVLFHAARTHRHFLRSRCGLRQKNQKVQVKKVILIIFYILNIKLKTYKYLFYLVFLIWQGYGYHFQLQRF